MPLPYWTRLFLLLSAVVVLSFSQFDVSRLDHWLGLGLVLMALLPLVIKLPSPHH